MHSTEIQPTALRQPFSGAAPSTRPRAARVPAALLFILLAAAQLCFGAATANTCATLEDFPCGP